MEIRVRQTCHMCKGEGIISRAGCKKCGSLFEADVDLVHPFLPCGHSRIDFLDEWPCLDCMGSGKVEAWMTVEEWITTVQGMKTA
jgi:hypothetical protein